MPRNLIITGGIYHPFGETSAAIAALLERIGVTSETTEDVNAAVDALGTGDYALVTINALRWRMLNHEKYEPFREQWQFELEDARQQLLSDFVTRGGGLLGLHTASICFDTWSDWGRLLGASWDWSRSFHPDPAPLRVRPVSSRHVICRGVGCFTVTDELYHHLHIAPGADVLLDAEAPDDGSAQALMVAQQRGLGRTVYDALGHDAASLAEPVHARIILKAAAWLLGRPGPEIEAL